MKTKTQLFFFVLLFPVMAFSNTFTPKKIASKYKEENPIFYFDLVYARPNFKGGALNGGGFKVGLLRDMNRSFSWQGGIGYDYSRNSNSNNQDSLPNFNAIKYFSVPYFYFEPTINCNDRLLISFPIKTSFNGSIFDKNYPSGYDNKDFARLNNNAVSVFSCGLNIGVPVNDLLILGIQSDYRFVYDYKNIQPSVKQKEFNGVSVFVYTRFCL